MAALSAIFSTLNMLGGLTIIVVNFWQGYKRPKVKTYLMDNGRLLNNKRKILKNMTAVLYKGNI